MEQLMEYINPELLILIPVLYLVGMALKRTQTIEDTVIPLLLGIFGMLLAVIYTLATGEFLNGQEVLRGIFVGVTQGILCAGASVYANQLIKQAGKGR